SPTANSPVPHHRGHDTPPQPPPRQARPLRKEDAGRPETALPQFPVSHATPWSVTTYQLFSAISRQGLVPHVCPTSPNWGHQQSTCSRPSWTERMDIPCPSASALCYSIVAQPLLVGQGVSRWNRPGAAFSPARLWSISMLRGAPTSTRMARAPELPQPDIL